MLRRADIVAKELDRALLDLDAYEAGRCVLTKQTERVVTKSGFEGEARSAGKLLNVVTPVLGGQLEFQRP